MSKPEIIRFEPHGPADTGLKEWFKIDPRGLEAGNPVQNVHIYDEDEGTGYLTGVWDCTPMTIKFGPYGEHEFMFLLEGSLIIVLADGTEVSQETPLALGAVGLGGGLSACYVACAGNAPEIARERRPR